MLFRRLGSTISQIVSVFLLCLSMSAMQAMQQDGATQFPEPKIPTLIEWADKCFSQLPEYTNEYKTVLTGIEFLGVIEKCKNMYQNSAFGKKENWLDGAAPDTTFFKDSGRPDKEGHAYTWDCVQKYKAPVGNKACFIGDIHGCLHALLRDLWGLFAEKKLDNNFKLAPGVTVICLGDYVDRGHYGVEVLYTLCLLKMANWDRVFLLRGNHENYVSWSDEQGFFDELKIKFKLDQRNVMPIFLSALKLVRYFPLSLFFQSGASVIQCCHGGICSGYNPVNLLKASETQIFERIKPIVYEIKKETAGKIESVLVSGDSEDGDLAKNKNWVGHFCWVDFTEKDIFGGVISGVRGLVYGKNGVKDYLERINTSLKEAGLVLRLEGFFRGHQHAYFGLKIPDDENYWKWVYTRDQRVNNEILVSKCPMPVFTFSTTSGAPSCGQPYDCYGVLTPAQEWKDWTLKVYERETPLKENFIVKCEKIDGKEVKRFLFKNEKYVEIDACGGFGFNNQYSGMPIDVRWVDEKDKKKPIGDALIKLARELQPSDIGEKEEDIDNCCIKRKREEKEEDSSGDLGFFDPKRKKTE